jgi:hypothetical protein
LRPRARAAAAMADLSEDAADDAALESLGYKQELTRGMTWLCVHRRRRVCDVGRTRNEEPC